VVQRTRTKVTTKRPKTIQRERFIIRKSPPTYQNTRIMIRRGVNGCSSCQDPSTFLRKQDYQGSDLIRGGVKASSAADCCSKCRRNRRCKFWTYGTANPRKGRCWLKKNSRGHQRQRNRESGKVCRRVSVQDGGAPLIQRKRFKVTQNDRIKVRKRFEVTKHSPTRQRKRFEVTKRRSKRISPYREDIRVGKANSPRFKENIRVGKVNGAGCVDCNHTSTFLRGQDYHGHDIKVVQDLKNAAQCCRKCKETKGCKYWTFGSAQPRKGYCWLKSSSRGHERQANRDSGHVCQTSSSSSSSSPWQTMQGAVKAP
jgi:hypothetical protein